jgi:iron complex transport system ATP-binding protein
MVEIRELGLDLDGKRLLSGISLAFNDGEVTGIIGRGGAGKSLFLDALSGTYRTFDGEILVDRRPLRGLSRRDLGRMITCHVDEPQNEDERVREFLKLARLPFKKFLNPLTDYDLQIVDDCMALLELGDMADVPLRALSGSYAKRAVLAFALARDTGLLLLDDPTAGLDLRALALLQKALSRYALGGKNIVVIASNDLNFIAQTADRIVVLDGGAVVMEGGPDIIDADMVKRFFGLEVFVSKNVYNGKPNVHFFPEN